MPPSAEVAADVETFAYNDKTPLGRTVAVWAVPLVASLATKPSENALVKVPATAVAG